LFVTTTTCALKILALLESASTLQSQSQHQLTCAPFQLAALHKDHTLIQRTVTTTIHAPLIHATAPLEFARTLEQTVTTAMHAPLIHATILLDNALTLQSLALTTTLAPPTLAMQQLDASTLQSMTTRLSRRMTDATNILATSPLETSSSLQFSATTPMHALMTLAMQQLDASSLQRFAKVLICATHLIATLSLESASLTKLLAMTTTNAQVTLAMVRLELASTLQ